MTKPYASMKSRPALLGICILLAAIKVAAADPAEAGGKEQGKIPADFKVTAEWGSHAVVPSVTRHVSLVPDPKAKEGFHLDNNTTTKEPDGGQTKMSEVVQTLAIGLADVRKIHRLVVEGNFFALKDKYEPEEEVDGGGWLEVSVTSGGRTKTVRSNNVRVEGLNAIRDGFEAIIERQEAEILKLQEVEQKRK